jgi:hypothetical protein
VLTWGSGRFRLLYFCYVEQRRSGAVTGSAPFPGRSLKEGPIQSRPNNMGGTQMLPPNPRARRPCHAQAISRKPAIQAQLTVTVGKTVVSPCHPLPSNFRRRSTKRCERWRALEVRTSRNSRVERLNARSLREGQTSPRSPLVTKDASPGLAISPLARATEVRTIVDADPLIG